MFTPPEILSYEFIDYNGFNGFLLEFIPNDLSRWKVSVDFRICEKEPSPYPFNRVVEYPKLRTGCVDKGAHTKQSLSARLGECDGVNGFTQAGEYEKIENKILVKMYINRSGCEQYLGWDPRRDTFYDWDKDWVVETIENNNFEWYIVPTMISIYGDGGNDCSTRYIFQDDPTLYMTIEPSGPSIHYIMRRGCNTNYQEFNLNKGDVVEFPTSHSSFILSYIDYGFEPLLLSDSPVYNGIPSLKLYP